DARDARAVPVDHEETERTFHPLIGTTTACGASAGFSFDIRHWPSSTAPASIMTTGASTSPVRRAVLFSSTRSLALTSPTTPDPLTVDHQDAGPHGRLDDAPLADDQGVLGRQLTAQLRIEHHGAGAGVPPLDLRILIEEGPETAPHLFALSLSEHDAPHC